MLNIALPKEDDTELVGVTDMVGYPTACTTVILGEFTGHERNLLQTYHIAAAPMAIPMHPMCLCVVANQPAHC